MNHAPATSFTLRPKGRVAVALRLLSLLLALCCFWSFAGAGVAMAISPSTAKPGPAHHRTIPIIKLASGPHLSPFVLSSSTLPTLTSTAPPTSAMSSQPDQAVTLLDEAGHLTRPTPIGQVQAWKQEMAQAHISCERQAQLHLWLGEWQLATNEQPETAQQHFRQAQLLTQPQSQLYYLAAYDKAIALSYASAYQEAVSAFGSLLKVKNSQHGYSHLRCALWLHHVSQCAEYHTVHADLGIPEPTRLDPLCGAAALAASLRSLSSPYDKKTVLSACRVTGEGSSLQNVMDAATKLGMDAHILTTDDAGLRMLPKPLIAYVEHDHFVAVTRADMHGVSYLCSDCGMWPGGEVNLTWRQWHTMNAGLYGLVSRPDSLWSGRLALLSPDEINSVRMPAQVASIGSLKGLSKTRFDALLPFLRRHVVLTTMPFSGGYCGSSPPVFVCQVDGNTPTDGSGGGTFGGLPGGGGTFGGLPGGGGTFGGLPGGRPGGGLYQAGSNNLPVSPDNGPDRVRAIKHETPKSTAKSVLVATNDLNSRTSIAAESVSRRYGAQFGDPVNLATGEEEYGPNPDISVYNPTGPSVVWQRMYRSLRGPGRAYPYTGSDHYFDTTYQSDDFGAGWSQPYNVGVIDTIRAYTAGNRSVLFANGSKIVFIPPATGPTVPTATIPVLYPAQRPGFPMILKWVYDSTNTYGHFEVIMKNRTRWITGALYDTAGAVCPLTQITDRNGNSIYFNYATTSMSAGSYGWPLLSSITSGTGGTGRQLLTIQRNSNGSITSVSDSYNRSVYYSSSYQANSGVYYLYPQGSYEVTQVSQIVPTGAATQPSRWAYEYESVSNGEGSEQVHYLHTISTPSPTGMGLSQAYIWYSDEPSDSSGNSNPNYGNPTSTLPFVSALVDSNGNQRLYTSVNASGQTSYPSSYTKVTVQHGSTVAYSYTVSYDANMNELTRTDGAGHALSTTVYDSVKTYQPSTVTDGNGKTSSYTYDNYGNMLTMTPPSSAVRTPAVTTNTYSYTNFALGEMIQTQTGSKTPVSYIYYDSTAGDYTNSGLVKTVTGPLPSSADGSSAYLLSTYAYDTLGNPKNVYMLGSNSTATTSTTSLTPSTYSQISFNYLAGYNGYTVPSESIGQPLTVTIQGQSASGGTTSQPYYFQYDGQSNPTAAIDALGNKTTQSYTIANAPLQTVLPATGQSGSGHAGSANAYLYTEPASLATMQWPAITLQYGPLYTITQYDEAAPTAHAVRQVVNTYGLEGELSSVSGSTEPVTYAYDALYRVTSLKDAAANTTSYFYNPTGYLAQVVYPGAQAVPPAAPLASGTKDTVSFPSHDGEGNPLTRVDGRNQTTTYAYNDPQNLLTDITYPPGTIGAVHFGYDAYRRRSTMTDGTGSQTYAYDDDDNLTSKTVTWAGSGFSAQSVSYVCNPDGSRQSMLVGGRPWSYTYDGVGRLTSVVDYPSETTTSLIPPAISRAVSPTYLSTAAALPASSMCLPRVDTMESETVYLSPLP